MVTPANHAFSLRPPGLIDRLRSRILYLESYRNARLIPQLEAADLA